MKRTQKSLNSEHRFHARLIELGATLIDTEWVGTEKPYHAICSNGHDCYPRPHDVNRGFGVCSTCARQNKSDAANEEFRKRIISLGGKILETSWLGYNTPHHIICPNGHDAYPIPDKVLHNGNGICRICAGNDPAISEREFIERVNALGGKIAYTVWKGANNPHKIICKYGHVGYPRPAGVRNGQGICNRCHGKTWDVFYVVVNPITQYIKFGITSGDSKYRLSVHHKSGYTEIVRVITDLPINEALEIEQSCRLTLKLAGIKPIRGREYYENAALAIVLDIADNWPNFSDR